MIDPVSLTSNLRVAEQLLDYAEHRDECGLLLAGVAGDEGTIAVIRPCSCGLEELRQQVITANLRRSHETPASLTEEQRETWNRDGSKDWWQPTWERRTAISYGNKPETFVPLTLLTEALSLLGRARYFTPEDPAPALTQEINNFLGTFGIPPAGYSPRPAEKASEHRHTDQCWEPNSGCDMGRNENFVGTVKDAQK